MRTSGPRPLPSPLTDAAADAAAARERQRRPKSTPSYFFFFAFLAFFFAGAFFLAFFFAAIGMRDNSFSVLVRVGRIASPPKRKQYEWVAFSNAISTGFRENRGFTRLSFKPYFIGIRLINLYTDEVGRKIRRASPISQNCANHPSSGNPSRALRMALTVAAFALPPISFIT